MNSATKYVGKCKKCSYFDTTRGGHSLWDTLYVPGNQSLDAANADGKLLGLGQVIVFGLELLQPIERRKNSLV